MCNISPNRQRTCDPTTYSHGRRIHVRCYPLKTPAAQRTSTCNIMPRRKKEEEDETHKICREIIDKHGVKPRVYVVLINGKSNRLNANAFDKSHHHAAKAWRELQIAHSFKKYASSNQESEKKNTDTTVVVEEERKPSVKRMDDALVAGKLYFLSHWKLCARVLLPCAALPLINGIHKGIILSPHTPPPSLPFSLASYSASQTSHGSRSFCRRRS